MHVRLEIEKAEKFCIKFKLRNLTGQRKLKYDTVPQQSEPQAQFLGYAVPKYKYEIYNTMLFNLSVIKTKFTV